MKSKPKHPPSNSQYQKVIPTFKESLKLLFTNKSYICFLFCTSGIVGYYNMYGTIFGEVIDKYSITNNQISFISSMGNIGGVASALIFSIVIDRIKTYKKVFICLNLLCLL